YARKVRLLANELDHDHATDVWVIGITREGPQHYLYIRSVLTPTAFVVWNGHRAIDVGIFIAIVKRVLGDHRNLLRFHARAHACRYYQYVVTRSHSAIGTPETAKGRALFDRRVIRSWSL